MVGPSEGFVAHADCSKKKSVDHNRTAASCHSSLKTSSQGMAMDQMRIPKPITQDRAIHRAIPNPANHHKDTLAILALDTRDTQVLVMGDSRVLGTRDSLGIPKRTNGLGRHPHSHKTSISSQIQREVVTRSPTLPRRPGMSEIPPQISIPPLLRYNLQVVL